MDIKVNQSDAVDLNMVKTDWNMYNAIIFNLVQNAIKFNNQNGQVRISLDLNEHIGKNKGQEFVTTISDNGIGIEPQRLQHLFKPYGELLCLGQLNLVKHHGIGLGLSNAKAFVDFLGGEIQFTNTHPGNTEIKF